MQDTLVWLAFDKLHVCALTVLYLAQTARERSADFGTDWEVSAPFSFWKKKKRRYKTNCDNSWQCSVVGLHYAVPVRRLVRFHFVSLRLFFKPSALFSSRAVPLRELAVYFEADYFARFIIMLLHSDTRCVICQRFSGANRLVFLFFLLLMSVWVSALGVSETDVVFVFYFYF